jgi:hypothetical protein
LDQFLESSKFVGNQQFGTNITVLSPQSEMEVEIIGLEAYNNNSNVRLGTHKVLSIDIFVSEKLTCF